MPKCLESIYYDLITMIMDLFMRSDDHYFQIANLGLEEFSYKYGDKFLTKILENLKIIIRNGY